ncbi:uncharacterized protein [Nicotiana tomentosiformis]|uniref:uncharacterized protein n=1 Tax=Nicotiana tomentosiformis TaxID=4098 RepID=UPI00388CA946
MVGTGDDNIDLATRDANQQREQAARDVEEAAIRDAQIIYEKERGCRIAQNQPLGDFWDGLTPATRRTLSNAAVGLLIKKTPEEIVTILDELSEDANQWPSESVERRRSTSVHQVNANTSMQVHLDAMAKEIRKLTLALIQSEPHAACDIYGRGHPTHECQASTKEVNAVENYNFIAMGQRHPGFSGVHLETVERLDAHGEAIKELGTSLRNMERQVGHIEKILFETVLGTLPTDTKKNPKETMNVKKGLMKTEKKKKEEKAKREEHKESKHMPALPFPKKLCREKLDKQFEKFLDMLKKIHVNLPFTEVLSQMPANAKFLKDILTKK